MTDFRYGPVELYLVGFEGERPAPAVMQALVDQIEKGTVRLLDFVIVSKSTDGDVEVIEITEELDDLGFAGLEVDALGITGSENIDELAPLIEPGSSAAVVALELLFSRELASSLAASGGVVLSSERIPAPVVNALIDAADNEEGE